MLCLSPFHHAFAIVRLLACGSTLIHMRANYTCMQNTSCKLSPLIYKLFDFAHAFTTFLLFQCLFPQPYPSAIVFYMQFSRFEEKNHMSSHVITICGSTCTHNSLQQSYGIWSRSSHVNGLAPHGTCFHITEPLCYCLAIAVPSLLNHQPNHSICLCVPANPTHTCTPSYDFILSLMIDFTPF